MFSDRECHSGLPGMNRKMTVITAASVVFALVACVVGYLTVTAPRAGQATVTSKSLMLYNDVTSMVGVFDIVIQNTGYLLITRAECRIDDIAPIVSNDYLFPDQTEGFSGNFRAYENSYKATILLTYSDGSTSTIVTLLTGKVVPQ